MGDGERLGYQVNVLGRRFYIEGPRTEIEAFRDSLFNQSLETGGPPPDSRYELIHTSSGYGVFRDGEGPVFESKDIASVYWWMDYEICLKALGDAGHLLHIHGAALAGEGRAVLILGDSRSGKSTIAAKMLCDGYQFLADDVVLLEPSTRALRAFPRNLLVRERSLKNDEALAEFCQGRWTYVDRTGERKWLLHPAELGSAFAQGDWEVGDIFWLARADGAPALLKPMGMREMVEIMIRQTINLRHLFEPGIDALTHLAQRGRNFHLTAPEPQAAWDKLREHLRSPQPPGRAS